MRILIAANNSLSLSAPNIWLGRVLPLLNEAGFETEVVFFNYSSDHGFIGEWLKNAGIPCHYRRFSDTAQNVHDIISIVEDRRPQIVLTNVNTAAHYAIPSLRQRGVLSVGILRSDDIFYRELIDSFIHGRADDRLDGAVAVSEYLKNHIEEKAPNGFPTMATPSGAPLPSKRTQKSATTFRLVYAGRIVEEQKAIPEVVDSLIQLFLHTEDIEATIIGDGPERPALEQRVADAGLAERIRFPGMISPLKVQATIAQHDAFFLLSDYEGLSTALLEAMACGVPPIVMQMRSGIEGLIEDEKNGLIVSNRQDRFHQAIKRLKNDDVLWERLSKAARASVEKDYSSQRCAQRWSDYLRTLPIHTFRTQPIPPKDQIHLPDYRAHPQGIAKEDHREAKAPEQETEKGGLLIVRAQIGSYSETFLDDHETYLAKGSKTLWGYPLPHMLRNGGNILSQAEKDHIQNAGSEAASLEAYTPALAKWLRAVRPHTILVETALMAVRVHAACEQAGIPYVVHFHGLDAYDKAMLEMYREHYDAIFKSCSALVVVSRAMREQLRGIGAPAEKVILAPYGVNTKLPALAAPSRRSPQFLAVGRFVEKKAPAKTVSAFASVFKKVPDARLTMVGDGDLLSACKDLAKELKCDDAITFTGALPREQVSKLMSEARGFVQHSVTASTGDSEGLPLGILEAAAHGLPVVSTLHAGIPDAIKTGECGFLVKEHDVEGMTEAMLKLARDPTLAGKMGAAARQRVLGRFSRERSHQRLRKILEHSANHRPIPERADLDPQSAETIEASIQKAMTPELALGMAAELQALNKPEHVEAALLRAVAIDRNCAPAYLKLAQLYIPSERFAEAFIAMNEARRIGELPDAMQPHLPALQAAATDEKAILKKYLERSGMVDLGASSNPQRILVFTNLLPPQEMGGYGRTVWEFCDLLQKRGHHIRVLTGDMPHFNRPPEAGYERVEKHVRRDLELFGDWIEGKAVPKIDKAGMLAIARKNRARILTEVDDFNPTVCMAGNLDFIGAGFLEPLLQKGLPVLHRLGNFGTGYITAETPKAEHYCIAGCSQWLNDETQKEGWAAKRFEVVHPGSPIEEYYRAFPPAFDKLRICFASLIMPYKGPQVLMKALILLHAMKVPFECTFAGDSTELDFLDDLKNTPIENGFHDHVRFTGFLNRDGLAALYAKSNVMVFPSVFDEPFGKSQIEAMAAGVPVVTSATGGSGEIVRDRINGLHYKNNDAENLARQLAALHSNPNSWRQLSQQAQKDAFQFTTLNSVKKIESIYASLLEASARVTV